MQSDSPRSQPSGSPPGGPDSPPGGLGTPSVRPRWRKALVRLGVSGLLIALAFTLFDGGDVWRRSRDFLATSGDAWFLAVLAFLALHATGALKWGLFLRLSGAVVPSLALMRFYGLGLFANLCLPSLIGGDVLRAGLAMGRVPERREAVVLGSVVDRMADLLALGTLVLIGAALAPFAIAELRGAALRPEWILGLLFAGTLVGVALLRWMLSRPQLRRGPRKLARIKVQLARALRTMLGRPGRALTGFALCLGVQAGFVFCNAYLGACMGLELDLRLWFFLWPLAKLAAMAPISLGGLGVRELAFASLLAPFGIGAELAVAQSLIWQSVLFAGGAVGGAFGLTGDRHGRGAAGGAAHA